MLDAFAPLLDRTVLAQPRHVTDVSAWHHHIPLAFLLVHLTRPRVFVELGTHRGDSYCAFCQEVDALGLDTRCYAVDTWEGDLHTGAYAGEALADLRRHHDPLYSSFSTLMQMTFDEALGHFMDREIDLLHLDGEHTYDAVSHDFETWLPKLSSRGVAVLHDTNERQTDFGVWRLWQALRERYPGFDVPYGHGLGVLAVGGDPPPELMRLVEAMNDHPVEGQELLFALGERVFANGRVEQLSNRLAAERSDRELQENQIRFLDAQMRELDARAAASSRDLEAVRDELARETSRGAELERQFSLLTGSASWRLTAPLRLGKRALKQTVRNKAIGSPEVVPAVAQPPVVSRADRPLTRRPLVSVVVPTWNTDPRLLRDMVSSVQAQSYTNWEMCIADDGSTLTETVETLKQLAAEEDRINVVFLPSNGGIAAASNAAIELASGDYVALLDHDDTLDAYALQEFVALLDEKPETDVIYSDEDKIDSGGRRSEPFFKPDWSPEYFRGVMYVGHLLMIRRSLIDEVGGFDGRFDGVQDYELMLRVSEQTDRIEHLPLILYHWRTTPGSVAAALDAKPAVREKQVEAVQGHLGRLGIEAVAQPHPTFPHRATLRWRRRDAWPSVSIVIPTKDSPAHLGRCLASLYATTEYEPFEVIAVDNRTTDSEALAILDSHPVEVIRFDEPFNFSRACNRGVAAASGDYVVLLNNDIEVVDPEWLRTLVRYVELPGVGAVGPLLLDPTGRVQHAGVVLGFRGTADHVLRGAPPDSDGYAGSLSCTREVSAVTAACMIVPRGLYESFGGLDEYYATHYQDVDFCLRLRQSDHTVLFTPRTRLIHHESATRGDTYDHLDRALLLDRWGDLIRRGDPFYNANFSRTSTDYQVSPATPVRA